MALKQPSMRAVALVAVMFIILSVLSTLPLAFDLFGLFPGAPHDNDIRFNIWIIYWGQHALLTQPFELHQANIFHPEKNTYAYSEIELSHSLMMAPFIAVFDTPEFIYNLLLLLSLIIGGMGYYLLFYRFTGLHSAAIGGAVIIQFTPATFGRYAQMHLFGNHWLPWTLLTLWLWLDSGRKPQRWGWTVLTALFYSLHSLSGSHNAVFGLVITAVCGLYLFIKNRHWQKPKSYAQLSTAIFIIALILIPVFLPYFTMSEEMAEHRISNPEFLRLGSLRTIDFFTSGSHFYHWLLKTTGWPAGALQATPGGALWPGLIPLTLAIAAFISFAGRGMPDARSRYALYLADLFPLIMLLVLGIVLVMPASTLNMPGDFLTHPLVVLAGVALILTGYRLFLAPAGEHGIERATMWIQRRVGSSPEKLLWLGLFIFGLWTALGPDGFFYQLISHIPGLQLIRVPRRFFTISLVSLAALSAYGLAQLHKNLREHKRTYFAVFGAAMALFAVESSFAPIPVFPVQEPHPLYTWLGEHEEEFTVFEYPVAPEGYTEFIRQTYGSIHHWKKLIVGYSGYQSKDNIALLGWLNEEFPSDAALEKLTELDTRYVVVFDPRIPERKHEEIQTAVAQGRMFLKKSMPGLSIYQLSSWSE